MAMLPLSMSIDVGTLAYNYISKNFFHKHSQNPAENYTPEVNVVIPAYNEFDRLPYTINAILNQTYPIKKIYVLDDLSTDGTTDLCSSLQTENPKIKHVRRDEKHGKAGNINLLVQEMGRELDDYVFVVDADVQLENDCLEQMISNYNGAEVTTGFGYTRRPTNFIASQLYEGERWINSVFSFRKRAQSIRNAVYVVCGALSMYRTDVLENIPIPERTSTEDTDYTWLLQENKVKINYVPGAKAIGGNPNSLKGYWKRYDRWFSGTFQNLYTHGKDLNKNKSLLYTTIAPGLFEVVPYSFAISTLPLTAYFYPDVAKGILTADFLLSVPFFFMHPEGAGKALKNLPGIYAFKYFGSVVGMNSMLKTTYQKLLRKESAWKNTWESSSQDVVTPSSLTKKTFRKYGERILSLDDTLESLLNNFSFKKKSNLSNFIEINGEIAGIALAQKDGQNATLETLVVNSDYKHLKIEDILMKDFISRCANSGVKDIYLDEEQSINQDLMNKYNAIHINNEKNHINLKSEETENKFFNRYIKVPATAAALTILLSGATMIHDGLKSGNNSHITNIEHITRQLSKDSKSNMGYEDLKENLNYHTKTRALDVSDVNDNLHNVTQGENLWNIIENALGVTNEQQISKRINKVVEWNKEDYPILTNDLGNDGIMGDSIREGMVLKIEEGNVNEKPE